jgi:hypothetical protein
MARARSRLRTTQGLLKADGRPTTFGLLLAQLPLSLGAGH